MRQQVRPWMLMLRLRLTTTLSRTLSRWEMEPWPRVIQIVVLFGSSDKGYSCSSLPVLRSFGTGFM